MTQLEYTAEQDEFIRASWAEGKSTAQIAREFNRLYKPSRLKTRCSILGRARRIGATPKHCAPKARPLTQSERRPNIQIKPKPPLLPDPLPSDLTLATSISLHDATSLSCRYPADVRASDNIPRCCGLPIHPPSAYCSGHVRLIYAPRKTVAIPSALNINSKN